MLFHLFQHSLGGSGRLGARVQMRLPVPLQIRDAREARFAALTLEPLHSGVRRDVRQQTLAIPKALVAELTLERLVAVVLAFVHLLLAVRPKRFVAVRARVRQFAGVHRHVRLQRSRAGVRLVADGAPMLGPLAALRILVVVQAGAAKVRAAAFGAPEFVALFVGGRRALFQSDGRVQCGHRAGIAFDADRSSGSLSSGGIFIG